METHDIAYYIAHYSYLGIFIWFLLIDQITPIPEELILVTVGYITLTDLINPFYAGLAALLGLMVVDNTYYFLAHRGNKWIEGLQKKKRGQLLHKFHDNLEKHPFRTLFIIAFVPKVRFFGPILAGLVKMEYKSFFLVNLSGSATYVALYLSLGIFFQGVMENLIDQVDIVRHSVFGVFILIMAVLISLYMGKWLSK